MMQNHKKPKRSALKVALICFVTAILLGFSTHPIPKKLFTTFFNLKTDIEANYFSYDQNIHLSLLKTANQLVEEFPTSWYPIYYSGIEYLLLGNIIRAYDKGAAFKCYTDALKRFETIMTMHPSDEIQTLISFTYGKLASLQTYKMIYFGFKSKSHMIEAFEKYPDNPKRYLVAAIHLMYTPKIFGGSKGKSKKLLNQALALNKEWLQPDTLLIRWATDTEIKAHLAQLEILTDNHSKACSVVQEVLRAEPDYGFIKRDIIPQLPNRNLGFPG